MTTYNTTGKETYELGEALAIKAGLKHDTPHAVSANASPVRPAEEDG